MLIAQAASIVSVPTPPPVFAASSAERPSGERTRVAIMVRAGSTVLFDGALWVGARGQSSWRQTFQEALDPRCEGSRPYDARQNETSVQITTGYDNAAVGPRPMFVTVRWQRASDEGCAGARTVEMRERVVLEGSAPVVLRGDAGLTVELRRR